jgi:hypothetical protein
MSTATPLTEAEVHVLVDSWYHALDIHAPTEEPLAMVADEGLEFRVPEVTVTDKAGLNQLILTWYNTYFDEVHETKELAITTAGDQADVKLLTLWQCSIWNPPAARSERLAFHARQTWNVKRSPTTGKPVIVTYIVDSLEPVGESGGLPIKEV